MSSSHLPPHSPPSSLTPPLAPTLPHPSPPPGLTLNSLPVLVLGLLRREEAVADGVARLEALQEARRRLRETLQRHGGVLLSDHERANQGLGGVLQVLQRNLSERDRGIVDFD